MATADDYASWIVANQAKKGTPEFETVAQAYKLAKVETAPAASQQAEQPEPRPSWGHQALGAAYEGMLTGGPIGAMTAVGGAGLERANEALTQGAYDAGGKVAEWGGKLGLPPEVSGGLGYATNVGMQAIPAFVTGTGAGKLAKPVLEAGGRKLMQSALKPNTQEMMTGKGPRAIQTMLEEGANVTAGGVEKLQTKANALGKIVDDLVSSSSETVNKNAIVKALRGTLEKFTNQALPVSDRAAISAAADEFLTKHPLVPSKIPAQTIPSSRVESAVLDASGKPFANVIPEKIIPASGTDEIPVQVAQAIKQGTYKILGDKAYGHELTQAGTDAQKALARGLRQEIEAKIPGVAAPNAEQSRLINALQIAMRREYLSGNKNPAGLALLPHTPLAAAAFMADRSELIKSLLARLLYSGAERIPQAAAGTGMAAATEQGQQP